MKRRIKTFYELNADKAKTKTIADINTKNNPKSANFLKEEIIDKLDSYPYKYNDDKLLNLICEYLNLSNIDTKIDKYKKIEYIQIVLLNTKTGFIHQRANGFFDCFIKGKKIFEGKYKEFISFLKENF